MGGGGSVCGGGGPQPPPIPLSGANFSPEMLFKDFPEIELQWWEVE